MNLRTESQMQYAGSLWKEKAVEEVRNLKGGTSGTGGNPGGPSEEAGNCGISGVDFRGYLRWRGDL